MVTISSLAIDLFTDTAAILDFIVSDIYYGMLRAQIHTYLPPEHPIITIWNNRIQNGRRIGKKVYFARFAAIDVNPDKSPLETEPVARNNIKIWT